MALAVNLGLKGPQAVKERALHNVLTSKSAQGDMKQVLQSRAEIYGDGLDPNWFKPNGDLGAKAKTISERNWARAQLIGAPLLVAQLGAMEFRNRLVKGDDSALANLRLGTRVTVAGIVQTFSQVPPLTLLQLCYGHAEFDFPSHLLQHADDLDFVQDTATAVASSAKLNPVLNAVLASFNRRRRWQRFKFGHYNMELDRLRFADTASAKDGDDFVVATKDKKEQQTAQSKKSTRTQESTPWCHFFQRLRGCRRRSCQYVHKCVICSNASHGAARCRSRWQAVNEQREEEVKSQERPPNPRQRRARAE